MPQALACRYIGIVHGIRIRIEIEFGQLCHHLFVAAEIACGKYDALVGDVAPVVPLGVFCDNAGNPLPVLLELLGASFGEVGAPSTLNFFAQSRDDVIDSVGTSINVVERSIGKLDRVSVVIVGVAVAAAWQPKWVGSPRPRLSR